MDGFPLQPQRYLPLFAAIFEQRRLFHVLALPGIRGNNEALSAQVYSADGRTIFSSGKRGADDFEVREPLGDDAGGFVVSIAARKSSVAWLATEHLASRMLLILLLILGSSVATIVAVRLMAMEAKLTRSRTDFVSSVSHELRTPLAQIQIFVETLRLDRYTSVEQRDWIFDGIQRELTRLTSLVNNVLRFSRRDRSTGSNTSTSTLLELGPFLEEIVHGFAPLAATRSMRVEARCADDLQVSIDADSFRQVVLNLLENAVKYGREGQVIRVSTSNLEGRAQIVVEDEGEGVPPAERSEIWRPFYRGARALGTVATGSGIGLAVVGDIVVAHGGTARVEDAAQDGARFVVELPLANDRAAYSRGVA